MRSRLNGWILIGICAGFGASACGFEDGNSEASDGDSAEEAGGASGPNGAPLAPGGGFDPGMPQGAPPTLGDDSAPPSDEVAPPAPGESPNTNVGLGGAQDFGFFRKQLDDGRVPELGSFDAAGFFAEHHTQLPAPDCGDRVCLQAMLGVLSNLLDGANCTMLQLGLNSPIAANPDERPPLSLAVVVDVSGSMNDGNKIEFVRDGLELMLDGLTDGDRFSLITYNSEAALTMPMTEIKGNRAEARGAVEGLLGSGGTNLYAGLEEGYREVFKNYDSARQNRVILLSDGNPTIGITDDEQIGEMSARFNSEGVGLTTVGLGSDFNIQLMRDLSQRADGNFYFLENSGAVSEVFKEELSFFTVPVAFDLKLTVDAGSDYEFARATGSPLWKNTPTGGMLEVPSVFLAHRDSDTDVTEDGGRRGGGSALLLELMPRLLEDDDSGQDAAEVAKINVEFREPGSDEIIKQEVLVNYPRPPWELLDEGYFENLNSENDDVGVVMKSFVMLNIYAGLEGAVAAFHENDRDPSESIAQLERLHAALVDYNEEIEDKDIEFDMALVQQMIDVMQANGVPEPDPFDMPENPWPVD